jgi:hypothetical protein
MDLTWSPGFGQTRQKRISRTNELAKENIKANQNVKSNLIIEALTCLSNSKNTFAHSEIKAGKGF